MGVTAIIAQFKATAQAPREPWADLQLPPMSFLETLPGGVPRGCVYRLPDPEHALRHAMSLMVILKSAVIPKNSEPSLLYGQNLVWLLDTLQPLASILVTWPIPLGVGLAPVVQAAVDLVEAHSNCRDHNAILHHKASAALALVCSEFLQHTAPLLAEDEDGTALRRAFCFALVQLAKASIYHAPTARLAASALLSSAQRLVSENPVIGMETDFGVRPSCAPFRCQLLTLPANCSYFDSGNTTSASRAERGHLTGNVCRRRAPPAGPETVASVAD